MDPFITVQLKMSIECALPFLKALRVKREALVYRGYFALSNSLLALFSGTAPSYRAFNLVDRRLSVSASVLTVDRPFHNSAIKDEHRVDCVWFNFY